MAYVDRFIFRFSSVSGKAVRIAIADNDYTGAAVERRLGGSPQLRCELSGNIHGMSLEIPAECKVDDEFAVLYTSDPTRFAVRLEVDNVVVWRGFVTPELYAAPWVDPPYDVQITATDGLGELKMMEWPAIGSRTLKEILDTVLGATGLALGIRMISAAANDIAAAEDLLTGTTVNLDHMAGKSYYDVLDGLLGSLHCTISQRNGVWLLVRETDVTSLTSGGQVSDTSGNTYPVKSFGSSQTHDCWPVGRLTTEIVPAKSVVEVECPNHLASLIADPDMELNLWQTNGSWTGEDGGYYTLDLNEYISQVITVANASRDADPGFRIKVSSRHTTPFGVGIMRLTVMATGRDPRSGSDKTLYLKEVTTQGRTQMEWATEESHFDDGLGLPKTLDHQDCKEFETDIFRLPTSFNPLKSITVKVTAGKSTVCVHSVHIECMSVYDKAVTRLVMDNGARGDESNSPLFADSFVGNKGNFLLTNSLRGVAGAIVRTWSSDAIPSVPYGEWLSKDMALSVATPRLRMSGRLFTVTSLPALFYSNKGLSYITEEWSLDLLEDEADISLISLPAAALSTVSVSVIVEDNDGRKGTVSGGEIVSPKTGDSSSGSGYLDWFIAESYEEDGETKYRLKLNPKYQGMYAEGWVSAGGVSDHGGGGGGTGYLRDLLDVNASMSPTEGQALVWDDALGKWTAGDVSVDLTPFERIANRVTTVSSSSNHTQYPTAKAVYDIVNTMLSSAMRFQGVTSTALVDGSTTNPVIVDGASYTATRGDVVVRSDVGLEYLWTGARWQQLGDETSYAKKTVTITGSGYLTGGGNLEASSEIDIADAVKTKIDNGATAFSYFTDGAANEAIKLRTPRSIWGQSFDGSANVSGAMTGVTRIYMTENLMLGSGEAGIYLNKDGISIHNASSAWTADALKFDTSGNARFYHSVGIGVAPSYPLDVNGDSRISGKVYIGASGGYLEVVNVGTTASPVYALKSSLPFFSDSWVSAGGVSPTGSGGGITGYLKDLLDVNGSMIPVDGQALVWDSSLGDNGRWTSKNVSVDLTPFERTTNKVTSISASSTDGQYPSARAVYNALSSKADSSALSGYLPLTGGTLNSGSSSPTLTLNTSAADSAIKYQQGGSDKAWIGYSAAAGVYLYNSIRSRYLSYKDDGSLFFENNKVWHAGNDGAGSGLDADFLDGKQGAFYMQDLPHNSLNSAGCGYLYVSSGKDAGFPFIYGVGLQWGNSVTYAPASGENHNQWYQMLFGATDGNLYHSYSTNGGAWNDWEQIAFTSSNVASATKLQTARSIWGQNFDGSADVSGAMTGVTSIDSLLNFDTTNNRLGIRVVAPAYPLDVDGIIRAEKLIGTATGITETSLEDEDFTFQETPAHNIADGYRIDRIKGNTIVSDGELVNNSAEAIETVGFNQWDEVWEPGAIYADGSQGSASGWIRSKNFCPCIPGADYYYINAARLLFYDSSEKFVQLAGAGIVTAPANAAYFKISTNTVSYNHNICVNISDPDRNGEYESYWSAKTALGLSSIKVKDSNGNIHEINGLALAGKIYDDITGAKLNQRVGRINLGSLNWAYYGDSFVALNTFGATHTNTNIVCPLYRPSAYSSTMTDKSVHIDSNGQIYIKDSSYTDAASFKAAMSGVMLYYELATPVTYDLVSSVPLSGRIDGNGTMRVISDGPVAPFRGDITYGCNPGQMGADASSVKSYLDTMLEIKVVDGVPMLHTTLPFYSDSFVSAGGLSGTGGSGSGSALRDLSDVQLPEIITTGSALVYNGEKWVQSDAAFVPQTRTVNGLELSSNISLSLGDLSNVNTAGASNGQSLIYDGSEWIAGTPAGAKFFHGTCSTSSSSNTKVVDCPSFTSTDLVAGTAIAIVMYNRCDTTSTVTINVNGTGANTLLAGFANRKAWSAGELILAVYDGSGEWDMLPTWYYTYYYGGGGSGGGSGTGSTVVVTPRLSSGTRIATITVDGSGTDLYAPSVSVTQTQGSTGGTRIASVNSTAIYAPTVTVTQVQTSGVEVARIKVGSANPVSIFAPSGSGGASGVQTVVGKTGDVTTAQIADALTNAGYKLTDTVVDTSSFLPLSAGSGKALTGDLYTRAILPTASNTYDLGSSSKYFNNNYMKRIYLADGVYIEYDSTNRCVYVHGAGIATDSFVSAGGVSNT